MPFDQNLEGHTFEEFKEIAKKREKEDEHIDWEDDQAIYDHIEENYWNYVENQMGSPIKVEYAADLNASKYGNGFGMKNQANLPEGSKPYVNHPWNFANFQKSNNSLL